MGGKLVLKGEVELLSPALIGSGKSDNSDTDMLRDSDGKPMIPATSFVGVLQSALGNSEKYKKFWGYSNGDKNQQSRLSCSDLMIAGEYRIVIRDGIKIDNMTGMVADGSKYQFEVVESGAVFELNMEVSFGDNEENEYIQILSTIYQLLMNDRIRIGALTNNGFGKLLLKNCKVYKYDFAKSKDVLYWLKREYPGELNIISQIQTMEELPIADDTNFMIEAELRLKNSFISRSYSTEPADPDAVSIKSGGKYIITGKSIKTAMRNRIIRILNTLDRDAGIVTELFGYVDEKTKKAKGGRVRVNEVSFSNNKKAEQQTRIKIDRFTGGTMDGALLEEMAVFAGNDDCVTIILSANICEDYEAGLLLLALKDLMTGDLAIGGGKSIGRGVFEGKSATITWEKKEYKLEFDKDNGRPIIKQGGNDGMGVFNDLVKAIMSERTLEPTPAKEDANVKS